MSRKIRVALFAMTGMGNRVLDVLLKDDRVEVVHVFTVKFDGPFPYYPERQLIEACEEYGVDVTWAPARAPEVEARLWRAKPDLMLVATFNQILPAALLSVPPLGGVNIHPSLLPAYRGPNPTQAVLRHSEVETGVSYHFLSEELDAGDILLQRTCEIDENWNDGDLRKRLYALAAEMVPEFLGGLACGSRPSGQRQDETGISHAPRPSGEDLRLDNAEAIEDVISRARAYSPFPGLIVDEVGTKVNVWAWERLGVTQAPDGIVVNGTETTVTIGGESVLLHCAI